MTSDLIRDALAAASDTAAVVVGPGVVEQTGPTFTTVFPGQRAVVVADETTWAVAGPQVTGSLRAAGAELEAPVVYPGHPVLLADGETVADLRQRLEATDAVACSVGSGSLNDVAKLASHQAGRRYQHVCTAASVDGYTSSGAAVTVNGVKTTHLCPAPLAVVAPLDIMAAAPAWLTATGLGDLVEKVPAGADWLIADALGVEAVDPEAWRLVQGPLAGAVADPSGLADGDLAAVGRLTEALMMSGLAVQVHGSTRPASGAGHCFSHQWEMEGYGRDWEPPLSHGFKVGLGTVAMCALYESVVQLDLTGFDMEARLDGWPSQEQDASRVRRLQPNPVIRGTALAQSTAKRLDPETARERLQRAVEVWPELRGRLRQQLLPASVVADRLKAVGAPWHPVQIGSSLAELRRKYFQAQTIRTRYTVLDLLAELGLLTELVDALFAPCGFWHDAPVPKTLAPGVPRR